MSAEAELQDLKDRLLIRARIRRQAKGRKSVKEGKPDRISDLLEEAADAVQQYVDHLIQRRTAYKDHP